MEQKKRPFIDHFSTFPGPHSRRAGSGYYSSYPFGGTYLDLPLVKLYIFFLSFPCCLIISLSFYNCRPRLHFLSRHPLKLSGAGIICSNSCGHAMSIPDVTGSYNWRLHQFWFLGDEQKQWMTLFFIFFLVSQKKEQRSQIKRTVVYLC